MASFSSGSATVFVEPDGVSFVEFSGPSASMGESGGPLGTVDQLLVDGELQAWLRDKLGDDQLEAALAEARRLVAARPR
jgi:hypothetical protein